MLAGSLLVAAAWATAAPVRHKHAAISAQPKTDDATTVEVINGTSRRVITLRNENAQPKAAISQHKHRHLSRRVRHRRRHRAATPPPLTAVILNGNQKETRVFRAEGATAMPQRNLSPVVIGIASGESKSLQDKPVVVGISSVEENGAAAAQPVVVGVASTESSMGSAANSQPVVVGVRSSGAQAAGVVEPVAVGVEPRPAKRPPYRPAKLDQQ